MDTRPAAQPLRIISLVLFLVGVALLAAALTLVFLGMRAVMGVGGFCAEGGAYVIQQHCPDGATPALMIGIWGGLGAAGLAGWAGSQLGGGVGSVVILAWPALFGSLGFNFLQFGLDPGPDAGGPDLGLLLCGVLFEAMALPVLVAVVVGIRASLRPKPDRGPGASSSISSASAGSPYGRPKAGSLFRPAPRVVDPGSPAMERALGDLDRALKAGLAARAARATLAPGATAGDGVVDAAGADAAGAAHADADAAGAAEAGAAAAAEVEGLVGGLERLAELHAQGAISNEEFAAAKARLLEAADR